MKRIVPWALGVLLLALRGPLFAGDIKVDDDVISVSRPDAKGIVFVKGPPRTVRGRGPLTFTLKNKATRETVAGEVHPDGSFRTAIPALYGDALRLYFRDGAGNREKERLRVPYLPYPYREYPTVSCGWGYGWGTGWCW